MKNLIIFLLFISLFFFLIYKFLTFIFPYMIPLLIFFGIYIFLSALLGSKKNLPQKNVYRGEVVKDVEIRVVDDDKESASKNAKVKQENI